MTNKKFFDERDSILAKAKEMDLDLVNDPKLPDGWCCHKMDLLGLRPSMDFVKKFRERMPDDDELHERGISGDSIDYTAWGYAMWDEWEEDENAPHIFCMWDWITYYGLDD